MAAAEYKKSSPYYTTSTYGKFLDILSYREITKDPSDVVYVIDKIYEYRPDLLAFDLYGDSSLWWVFRVRNPNALEDPLLDFVTGTTIYIPKKTNLISDLGI